MSSHCLEHKKQMVKQHFWKIIFYSYVILCPL